MSNFQPVNSNPTDGELITLCKILEAVSTGGGGGDSDVAVGADGVTRVPLNVNADGELKVNVEASINADLTDIENALATSNGILTTTAADTATIKDEAISIDNKLPALSSGRVPVEANNAASQVYNYTITGALAASTVIIGPIDCSQFREISVHVIALGTGGTGPVAQVSNDGTNWVTIFSTNTIGGSAGSNLGTAGSLSSISLYSARNFRIISQGNQTAGTTTLAVYASQQTTPKVSQTVSLTGNPTVQNIVSASANSGFSTYFTLISAASTNATSVKASGGTIGTLLCQVNSGQTCYLKIFNKSSAPVVGTDTPVLNIPIHSGMAIDVGTSFAGMRLSNGIAIALTRGQALLDSTPTTAGEAVINLTYA